MKKTILILGFLLCSWASASLGPSECINVDYSRRFGPIRDQDGHGYCWAFTGAALAEESFCKINSRNCGKSVSTLDISRCDWSLTGKSEGGFIESALYCAVDNGVCNEVHAPYDAQMSWGCSFKQLFLFNDSKCDRVKLKALYKSWHDEKRRCLQDGVMSSEEVRRLTSLQEGLIRDLRQKLPPNVLQNKDVRSLFERSSDEMDFLKRTLIGKRCEELRSKVKREVKSFHPEAPEFAPRAIKGVVQHILSGLRSNSSVAIGIDLGRTKLNKILGFIPVYSKDSQHGLVITGMRFNRQTNRCEVNLRNSWGAGADFNGWTSLADIEGGLMSGVYLK